MQNTTLANESSLTVKKAWGEGPGLELISQNDIHGGVNHTLFEHSLVPIPSQPGEYTRGGNPYHQGTFNFMAS